MRTVVADPLCDVLGLASLEGALHPVEHRLGGPSPRTFPLLPGDLLPAARDPEETLDLRQQFGTVAARHSIGKGGEELHVPDQVGPTEHPQV